MPELKCTVRHVRTISNFIVTLMLSRFRGILQESQMRHVVEASWSEKEIISNATGEVSPTSNVDGKAVECMYTMRADAMRVRSAWRRRMQMRRDRMCKF